MSSFSIKAIAGLIPIYLHLWKLSDRLQLRAHFLSYNHILRLLLKSRPLFTNTLYCLSLEALISNQQLIIKRLIVDMDNRFNKIFPSFDPLNKEFALGSCLINTFPSWFSFYSSNKQSIKSIKTHICYLNNISLKSSLDLSYTFVVSDTSIKNNIVTSIIYIHIHNKPIIKTIHYIVNVIFIEAELFALRYNINQATNISSISKIIIIMDSIHTVKRIFDSLLHLFQIYIPSISDELRKFFIKNHNNSIKF